MKKKLIILITGQKSRLELSSKIKNIIQPLKNIYNIMVVLSLSSTEIYTNKRKYMMGGVVESSNIASELMHIPHYINKIDYPEFKINEGLFSMYDKSYLGLEYKTKRAKNHVRQYYTLFRSWPIIKRFNPDLLIRIRDDAMLKHPIKLPNLIKYQNKKNFMITPIENSWGGINDKFAIISKSAIEAYLTKPFQVYMEKKKYEIKIKNPEQFIKYVYSKDIDLFISKFKINIFGQRWRTEGDRRQKENYIRYMNLVSKIIQNRRFYS